MHQHLDFAVDHSELACDGYLVGIGIKEGWAFVDTGVARVTMRQLDDQHGTIEV